MQEQPFYSILEEVVESPWELPGGMDEQREAQVPPEARPGQEGGEGGPQTSSRTWRPQRCQVDLDQRGAPPSGPEMRGTIHLPSPSHYDAFQCLKCLSLTCHPFPSCLVVRSWCGGWGRVSEGVNGSPERYLGYRVEGGREEREPSKEAVE